MRYGLNVIVVVIKVRDICDGAMFDTWERAMRVDLCGVKHRMFLS